MAKWLSALVSLQFVIFGAFEALAPHPHPHPLKVKLPTGFIGGGKHLPNGHGDHPQKKDACERRLNQPLKLHPINQLWPQPPMLSRTASIYTSMK